MEAISGLIAYRDELDQSAGSVHDGSMRIWIIVCSLGLSCGWAKDFRVGTGIADVTPEMGVPLDGAISQNGPVSEIHDPPHVRALVFDDGETKAAIAIVDNTMISASLIDDAKSLIEKGTGIPGASTIIAATHTHSTPRAMVGLLNDVLFGKYLASLPEGITDAVSRANRNLQPASIGWGSVDVPEYVHNRRWFVETSAQIANPFGEEGEAVRMNPGMKGLIEPAGPVDPEVSLLSVQDASGAPLAVLGNYGLHYIGGTKRGSVSADYFGVFSEEIKKQLGGGESFLGIMSNGTSGDINGIDFSHPRVKYEPFENLTQVGKDIASRAKPVVNRISHQSGVKVETAETVLDLKVRKPDAKRLEWAKSATAPADAKRLTRPQVYAREALELANYPDTLPVRIQALRIGDLGIVAIPCEVFAETGLAIKAAKVFPDTFVIELANGYYGYLPSAQQHEWGGYETWPARSSCLEVNAESHIREAAISLLRELASR